MEWLTLILAMVGLAVGGHHFVLGASAIGQRCGMSPVLVGATIVALGTSLPEWGVSVVAALEGFTDLSVGNVVGSNICNVCLILGLSAMLSPLPVSRDSLTRGGTLMLVATALLLAVSAGGTIVPAEGFLLLAVGVGAMALFVATRRENSDSETPFHWWEIPRAVVALGVVLASSHVFVGAAEEMARRWGVSEWTIGITVAAIGTSLPELVTSLAAVLRKQTAIVIGNVLGSNTLNILFVLGSAASQQVYDERFQAKYGYWRPIVEQSV
ncbi:MAG: sodium:calcium antiporter, partial [Planctomycetota bacterium]|nr:sodium:calcium antiporter [Planctomycetota bacterium]